MNTKFTPGPWTVDEAPDADGNWTIRPSDGSANGNTDEQPIATVYHNTNAALIAAAPELLEALKKAASSLRGGYAPTMTDEEVRRYCPAYGAALNAIARAEGR